MSNMINNSNQLSILIVSFDGYSDVWRPFYMTFRKYWNDCPFKARLITNHKEFSDIDTIKTGDETCWSERVLKALLEVPEKYVLLLLDDYLIGASVNNQDLSDAIKFLEEMNGIYLRLSDIPRSRYNSPPQKFYNIYADEEYGINLQASIWNVDYLKQCLSLHIGSPWDFEIGFLSVSVNAQHIVLNKCYGMHPNIIDVHNGILKGKWFPTTITYFSKRGIPILWHNRGKLSRLSVIKYSISVFVKKILPYRLRKISKKLLICFHFKFVSKY